MSAAILDQRHNPIGISRRSEQPRGVLAANIANAASTTPMQNRLELVTRSGPTAYNLASTDDLAEQSNCEGSKRSYSGGNFFRFANACLASADRRLSRSYSLRFRLDSVPASGAEPTARSLQRGARGLPSGLYAYGQEAAPAGRALPLGEGTY